MGRGNQKVCEPTTQDRFAAVLGTRRKTTQATPFVELGLLRALAGTPMPIGELSIEYGNLFLTFNDMGTVNVSSTTAFGDPNAWGWASGIKAAQPLVVNRTPIEVGIFQITNNNGEWSASAVHYLRDVINMRTGKDARISTYQKIGVAVEEPVPLWVTSHQDVVMKARSIALANQVLNGQETCRVTAQLIRKSEAVLSKCIAELNAACPDSHNDSLTGLGGNGLAVSEEELRALAESFAVPEKVFTEYGDFFIVPVDAETVEVSSASKTFGKKGSIEERLMVSGSQPHNGWGEARLLTGGNWVVDVEKDIRNATSRQPITDATRDELNAELGKAVPH